MRGYLNHARRHAAGGSDPLVIAGGVSAYCESAVTSVTVTAALNTDVALQQAQSKATDTTIFAYDATNHRIQILKDGTYHIWCRLLGAPDSGKQLPSVMVTYPTVGNSFGRGSDIWGTAFPYAMATGGYPTVGVNVAGYSWGSRIIGTQDIEGIIAGGGNPIYVVPHVQAPGDQTGNYNYSSLLRIWKIHDGLPNVALAAL